MVDFFKSFVKKLPGIRKVVEGRDRFIALYEQEYRKNEQLKIEKTALQDSLTALEERNGDLQTEIKRKNELLEEQKAEAEGKFSVLENTIREQKAENEQLKVQLSQLAQGSKSASLQSGEFWNSIYLAGGTSGTGSYNRLADFKAEIVNAFLEEKQIQTVAEIGCGDGNQLSLIHYPHYVGIDVSRVIVEKDRLKFQDYSNYCFYHSLTERERYIHQRFDMTISMDVIFHLLEEDVFRAYMDDLFTMADKYVVIYSSNHEEYTKWPEYRHRNFTGYVAAHHADWELIRYIPNKYPYKIGEEETTSAADFYIFQKRALGGGKQSI